MCTDVFIDLNEGRNLARLWYETVFDANPYIFGEKEFERDLFRYLIEDTYNYFKKVKDSLNSPWKEDELQDYKENAQRMFEIISYIGEYIAEQPTQDKSEDKVFTASCLVARALIEFARHDIDEYYSDGRKEPLLYYHPGWWKYEIMDSSNKDFRFYSYDINDGDMSDMIILAKYID